MTPGITQLYQASRIGNWCLHNIPLIVVPHPDYKENNGDAIQARDGFFYLCYNLYFNRIFLLSKL